MNMNANMEPLVTEWLKKVKVDAEIKRLVTQGVPLTSGDGSCSPEALQLLIELCSFPNGDRDMILSAYATDRVYTFLSYLDENDLTEYITTKKGEWVCPDYETGVRKRRGTTDAIREISSWLSKEALSERLEELFFNSGLESALVALGVFGTNSVVRRIEDKIVEWDASWKTNTLGPKHIAIVRGAMLYNNCEEAKRYFESVGMLREYKRYQKRATLR